MAAPQITVTFNPPLSSDSGTTFDTKAFDTVSKWNSWGVEANAVATYCGEQADNALAAALGGNLPPLTGQALKYLRVNAGETAAEFATPVELSQAQAEDGTSTVFGQVSGQRLAQAVAANETVVDFVTTSVTRVTNTVYQNTTGKPFLINLLTNGSGAVPIEISPDGLTWTTVGYATSGGLDHTNTFVVDNGWRWRINGTTAIVNNTQQVQIG